jgi:hypothetical protein
MKIIPLWHFDHTIDLSKNIGNCLRLSNYLNNANVIRKKIMDNADVNNLTLNSSETWNGCFGVQSYINYDFLSTIQTKYNIFHMLDGVLNRNDRCSLERIMGIIFHIESSMLYKHPSLLGTIFDDQNWGYSYDTYCKEYKSIRKPLVKVWTGR